MLSILKEKCNFLLIVTVLVFFTQLISCSLIGIGRRQPDDKILLQQYYETNKTEGKENHTIYIEITIENRITFIQFDKSTIFTTASVEYDGDIAKFIQLTAYNTTEFFLYMTIYGYEKPKPLKKQSSFYQEVMKLDKIMEEKRKRPTTTTNNTSNNLNNLKGKNNEKSYNKKSNEDLDYDPKFDELLKVIARIKTKKKVRPMMPRHSNETYVSYYENKFVAENLKENTNKSKFNSNSIKSSDINDSAVTENSLDLDQENYSFFEYLKEKYIYRSSTANLIHNSKSIVLLYLIYVIFSLGLL